MSPASQSSNCWGERKASASPKDQPSAALQPSAGAGSPRSSRERVDAPTPLHSSIRRSGSPKLFLRRRIRAPTEFEKSEPSERHSRTSEPRGKPSARSRRQTVSAEGGPPFSMRCSVRSPSSAELATSVCFSPRRRRAAFTRRPKSDGRAARGVIGLFIRVGMSLRVHPSCEWHLLAHLVAEAAFIKPGLGNVLEGPRGLLAASRRISRSVVTSRRHVAGRSPIAGLRRAA